MAASQVESDPDPRRAFALAHSRVLAMAYVSLLIDQTANCFE
jgi:hypothetical protein